jgi:hypothetical protein
MTASKQSQDGWLFKKKSITMHCNMDVKNYSGLRLGTLFQANVSTCNVTLYTFYSKIKQSLYRPGQVLKFPRVRDFRISRHMKVIRLLALGTGRLYLPTSINTWGDQKKPNFLFKKIFIYISHKKHLVPFKILSIGGNTLVQSFFFHCVKLTTTIVVPPSNASKWQMGFNSAFKGLKIS